MEDIRSIRERAKSLKSKQALAGADLTTINSIIDFLSNDKCFFAITIEAAISLLLYLGVSKKDVLSTYRDLTTLDIVR